MICIDIGCGRKKVQGAIGIDFSPLSDADIIIDLNTQKLPFDNDSVDFIHSSHAFEHLSVDGFLGVMQECYRVLKPTGQMYLLVPYFTTGLNWANIFHNNKICFNEHTFRFFSSDLETTALTPSEYFYPSCPHWGLRYSANSELNIEFKTERIDYIYMPEYRGMPEDQLLAARRSRLDVVEQISYHLRPVKPCPQRPERGPIDGDSDQHAFIKEQIDHLVNQENCIRSSCNAIDYFRSHKNFKEIYHEMQIIFKKINSLSNLERKGDFYCKESLIYPPYDVIRQLDVLIQHVNNFIVKINDFVSKSNNVTFLQENNLIKYFYIRSKLFLEKIFTRY